MNTFRIGGVHPQDNKKYSANQAIIDCPLPKQAIIPLIQHIGAPAVPVVEKGEKVRAGQLIAKAGGFVSANIHSPFSGVISKIDSFVDGWGLPQDGGPAVAHRRGRTRGGERRGQQQLPAAPVNLGHDGLDAFQF